MIGEFDYNDIFHGEDDMHYWLTYVLFVSFLIVMTIIIMNLLVCFIPNFNGSCRKKRSIKNSSGSTEILKLWIR